MDATGGAVGVAGGGGSPDAYSNGSVACHSGGAGGGTNNANGGTTTPDDADDTPTGWNCSVHPSVFFLLGTLVLTSCSTAMLCAAIMTDHWEEVTWKRDTLADLMAARQNVTPHLHIKWLLDGKVARITVPPPAPPAGHHRETVTAVVIATHNNDDDDDEDVIDPPIAFLAPMHGGIWTLCVSLADEEVNLLGRVGFPPVQTCANYLAGGLEAARGEEPRSDWQHRMQNLSISCALVCLIVLGSAALVGAFGVCKHQISAVLVTGVMYLLAASFALFTLTIIHFKRTRGAAAAANDGTGLEAASTHVDGTVDGVVLIAQRLASSGATSDALKSLLSARVFSTSWSLDLGWGGVMLTVMASVLWILLSKIMRFNPISSMINY